MSETPSTAALREARDLLVASYGRRDDAVERFQWPLIEGRFNWATDWFDVMARGNHEVALWIVEDDGSETRVSFDEMATRSDRVAVWFESLGMRPGDAVVVMLGNQVELWETMLAVMKVGGVIMPSTPALGAAELAERVERGSARFVVANLVDTAKFDGLPDAVRVVVGGARDGWSAFADSASVEPHPFEARTGADDPVLYYFTSGTTSRPKLVVHTQVSYPVGHLTTMYYLGLRPGDVHLNISSPGWAKHAWSSFFAPWNAQATIFVTNYARFDADALLEQLRSHPITTFCAPPTVWRMLIQADLSGGCGTVRQAISSGEPLNAEVISRVEDAWGLTVRDGFGQTEMTAVVGNTPGMPVKPGSMGRPLPGAPVVVLDLVSGVPVTEGEGEICLDLSLPHPNLMAGYFEDDERTAEAMRGGYYHSGDVASVDHDGYLHFVGRSDDVFKSSDYKISPFELESALVEHPAVAEAAVVPAHDAIRLSVPKAYVVLAAGWEADEATALAILAFARDRLSPFQRVRRVEFLELPKTISGKIRRVELRQREDAIAAGTLDGYHEWSDEALRQT